MSSTVNRQAELREALLLQQELEDIHQRLQIIEALPISFSFSGIVNKAKNAVAAAKNAVVSTLNAPSKAQDVSNALHNKFKVEVANDGQGNLKVVVNGMTVDVTLNPEKTAWQVTVNGATYPTKGVQDLLNVVDAHTRAAAPTAAQFRDVLRHSQTIMRCRPAAF